MPRLVRGITTAGIAIFVAYILSIALRFQYDSWSRGLQAGMVTAAISLEILWVLAAAILAAARWRHTSTAFRVMLTLNAAISVLLIGDTIAHR